MSKNGHCPSGKKTWAMNRCHNGQSIDPPCTPLFHDKSCSQSDKPLQHCWNLWTLCKPKLHGVENTSKMISLRTQHAWISSGKWIDKLPVLCSLTEHPGCTVSCECLRGELWWRNARGELLWKTARGNFDGELLTLMMDLYHPIIDQWLEVNWSLLKANLATIEHQCLQ